ncbi:MAG: DUF2127 domain-containing protein [Candidatus Acidiferrales bacterium]
MKPLRSSLLDKTFHAGITIKGFDGILECIGGVLIWFIKPTSLNGIVRFAAMHDLPGKYDEMLVAQLLHTTEMLANGGKTFASVYLITHGLSKVVLVAALWMNKLWAYPLTMFVFAVFCVYQMHRYTRTHSIFLVLLTIFDLFLIYLTWREYVQKKRARDERSAAQPDAALEDGAK